MVLIGWKNGEKRMLFLSFWSSELGAVERWPGARLSGAQPAATDAVGLVRRLRKGQQATFLFRKLDQSSTCSHVPSPCGSVVMKCHC